jgi:hypothetical protein
MVNDSLIRSARPKAYSYIRFSKPEQARGFSLDRQKNPVAAFAEEHGLDLSNESYLDLGVSAFRGKTASQVPWGRFSQRSSPGESSAGPGS